MEGNRRALDGANKGGRDSNVSARLASEFDPRLAEVWLEVFQTGTDFSGVEDQLACFLRMAYLRGYSDALWEPVRGSLFHRLGIDVPPRRRRSPRSRGRLQRSTGEETGETGGRHDH